MIKKFKNGSLHLKADGVELDEFINNEMFWNDLDITYFDDNYYIADYNKQLIYDIPYNYMLRGSNQFMDDMKYTLILHPMRLLTFDEVVGDDKVIGYE